MGAELAESDSDDLPDGSLRKSTRINRTGGCSSPGSTVSTPTVGWDTAAWIDSVTLTSSPPSAHEVGKSRPNYSHAFTGWPRCLNGGLGTHQGAIGTTHIDYYLDEFTFRFNRRRSASRGKLFFRLLEQAVQVGPVTYDEIIGKPSHHK
jgi:hypothetical protein